MITSPTPLDRRIKHDPMDVYRFIIRYKTRNDGNSPSMPQIAKATKLRSASHVSIILHKLEEAGLLILPTDVHQKRSIIVTGARWLPPQTDHKEP